MSQAIQDAVNISQIVYNRVTSNPVAQNPSIQIKNERLYAIRQVSNNRGVSQNAVRHSVTTALSPDVWSIDEFDELLKLWIFQNIQQIKFVLRQHAKDQQDFQSILNLP